MSSSTAASCWICLDEGEDEHGRPLMRNCACRGESGWAHVSCLSGYAKTRTDGMTVGDFTKALEECKGNPWVRLLVHFVVLLPLK